jgi:hypothetical protein
MDHSREVAEAVLQEGNDELNITAQPYPDILLQTDSVLRTSKRR